MIALEVRVRKAGEALHLGSVDQQSHRDGVRFPTEGDIHLSTQGLTLNGIRCADDFALNWAGLG